MCGTGKVSYEFRNFLLNGPDIAVSLLARCAGPGEVLPDGRKLSTRPSRMVEKVGDISDADKAELDTMTDPQRDRSRSPSSQACSQIAARFGVTPAQARQCLTDPKRGSNGCST